jgi:hypothetical protein
MESGSNSKEKTQRDRKLGDEWLDWDGSVGSTAPVRKGMFVGVAAVAVTFLICTSHLAVWLVEPRLISISPLLYTIVKWGAWVFTVVVLMWLLLFALASLAGSSFMSGVLIFPHPVNWLLSIALRIGGIMGISKDKLVNSFLRIHNILLPGQRVVAPEELLVLLPRCLTREANSFLRSLRDRYGFAMATADGGQEARKKIREVCPRAIVAIACERDLLSGFVEVNPRIPVVGLPNLRPEGPCKNTDVNRAELESLIRKLLAVR